MSPAPRVPIDGDPSRKVIADAIARLATEAGLPAPVRDGRLDQVADDLARTTPDEQQPSFEVVLFLLSHYGVVEPEPGLLYGRADPRSPVAIVELVRSQLTSRLREAPQTRLGVGVFHGDPELSVVIAFQAQNFELRPVPRALAAGLVAHIEGRLFAGYRLPKVIVSFTDGTVTDLRVRGTGSRFEASIGCRRDKPGPLQIEIAADTDRGPNVLANFPVYCAVVPPRRAAALILDTSSTADPEEIEAEMVKLVNRDRVKQGLWPVRVNDRLTQVARAYSREMASTGVVAHFSPRTGNVADRLGRARLDVELVGENVGRDYSAAAAHRGFMASPGHRGNVVDPRMTSVGIGVARGSQENGLTPLFITELFAVGLR
jgi:uncharacterized protein YkwD